MTYGVDGPEDEGEAGNGGEELANLAALAKGSGAAVDGELPDNDEVGNAGNGVPAPLGGSVLTAKGSKETGEDHDQVGNDGNDNVATAEAGEQRQVEKEERGGDAPVNVAGPVDLAEDDSLGVGADLVRLGDDVLVVGDALAAGLCGLACCGYTGNDTHTMAK